MGALSLFGCLWFLTLFVLLLDLLFSCFAFVGCLLTLLVFVLGVACLIVLGLFVV